MNDLQRIRQLAGLNTKQNISEGWMGSDDPLSLEKGGTTLGAGELDDSTKRELVRNFKDNGGNVEQTLQDTHIHPSQIEDAVEYLHYVADMENMPEEPHVDHDEDEVILGLDDDDYVPEDPTEYGERAADLDAEHFGKRFEEDLEEGLDNGYKTREVSGSDFFPDGADGPVVAKVGPSGAKQGDNPEQKKMQIDEVHREMVYQYRKFLKEGSSKNPVVTHFPGDQEMEQAGLISDLADIAARLPKQDNIWAGKLIKAFDHFGFLTPKQEAIVREILSRNA